MHKILIVDDNEMLREVLQLALEEDYQVFAARSGEEALGMLKLLQVDLVITDMNMGGMTGLELAKRITQIKHTAYTDDEEYHPKIILYTAMLSPALIVCAKSLGLSACLPKPFELEELKGIIKKLLFCVDS